MLERLMCVATVLIDRSFYTKCQVATLNRSSDSTWYKCLNRSLTRSCTDVHTDTGMERHIHTYGKPKKLYAPLPSC